MVIYFTFSASATRVVTVVDNKEICWVIFLSSREMRCPEAIAEFLGCSMVILCTVCQIAGLPCPAQAQW